MWGHLKTFVKSGSIANEETLHQLTPDACETLQNISGTFKMVRYSMNRHALIWCWAFWEFVVNCDLMNNTNSTVIKSKACTVNAL
jgi:hypothetical protein